MAYELSEVKVIRKKFNLTQGQLAKLADVSQSLIAKIEAGMIDPTYSKTRKIFESFDNLSKQKETKADEIMTKKLIFVNSTDKIREALKKMKNNGISQVPVVEHDKPVGVISETTIINKITDASDPTKLINLKVKDVMDDCSPVISPNTLSSVVSDLLKYYSILIVSQNAKIVGVITKADVLSKIYKYK